MFIFSFFLILKTNTWTWWENSLNIEMISMYIMQHCNLTTSTTTIYDQEFSSNSKYLHNIFYITN